MKNFKIAICLLDEDDKIISKKKLGVNWSIELEVELNSMFASDLKSEAANIILDEIKRELTKEVIEDFLGELK